MTCYLLICFQFHWRVSIVCLLCDAYMKWAQKFAAPTEGESKPFLTYALQWDFYAMFMIAGLGKLAFEVSLQPESRR